MVQQDKNENPRHLTTPNKSINRSIYIHPSIKSIHHGKSCYLPLGFPAIIETAEREKLRLDTWLNARRVAGAKADVQVNMAEVKKAVVFIIFLNRSRWILYEYQKGNDLFLNSVRGQVYY